MDSPSSDPEGNPTAGFEPFSVVLSESRIGTSLTFGFRPDGRGGALLSRSHPAESSNAETHVHPECAGLVRAVAEEWTDLPADDDEACPDAITRVVLRCGPTVRSYGSASFAQGIREIFSLANAGLIGVGPQDLRLLCRRIADGADPVSAGVFVRALAREEARLQRDGLLESLPSPGIRRGSAP